MSNATSRATYALAQTVHATIPVLGSASLKNLAKSFPVALWKQEPAFNRESVVALVADDYTGLKLKEGLELTIMYAVWLDPTGLYKVFPTDYQFDLPNHTFIATFVGEGDADHFTNKLNEANGLGKLGLPKEQTYFVIKQSPEKGGGPFFVMDSDVKSTMDVKSFACECLSKQVAESIAEALNSVANRGSLPDGDPNRGITFYVQKEVKHLSGTVLTLLDAAVPNPEQNAALKRLVKKESRAVLNKVWEIIRDADTYNLMAEVEPSTEEENY